MVRSFSGRVLVRSSSTVCLSVAALEFRLAENLFKYTETIPLILDFFNGMMKLRAWLGGLRLHLKWL
jgi:hypothetical protein